MSWFHRPREWWMLLSRILILSEIIINGTFIVFYSFSKRSGIPAVFGPEIVEIVSSFAVWIIPLVLFAVLASNFLKSDGLEDFLRRHVFSLIIFVPALITFGDIEFVYWLSAVHLFSTLISLRESWKGEGTQEHESENIFRPGLMVKFKISAAQLVLISWALITLVGALLLLLPVSSPPGGHMSFIDAIFVSTSAISTTGLSTVSLGDDLSLFGQVIVLILVQIGGIGFMTISSSLLLMSGKSFSIKESVMLQDILDASEMSELYNLVLDVVRYTFVIEFICSIILTIAFYQEGYEIDQSLWLGFFHSVSSFCTAGFGLFNNSLEDFATNSTISWTITLEALLGGLGFLVMKELVMVIRGQRRINMISVHSKVILATLFMLTILGTSVIFFGEFMGTMGELSVYDKFHVSLFQFVSAQSTSGFNSVPMASLQTYTIYFLTLIMFIGSSPGSTGGGIKITTLAILLQSVKSTLYGKEEVDFFERSIPTLTIVKAIAITIVSLIVVCVFIFIMVKLEPSHTFISLVFEVLSAFGTVGLSLGITSSLSFLGKLAIAIVMFIGRIGPLTMVLAVGERREAGKVKYPPGKIMIG